MKQRILTLIFLVCMAVTGSEANDSSYSAIGNQLVPLRETSIRVTKEILSIDLRDDGRAYIDVYYEFTNPEKTAKTVLMGFEADPPYPDEPDGWTLTSHSAHPYIENFTVEINGQRQSYRNAISIPGKFRPMKVEGMTIMDGGLDQTIYDENGNILQDGPQEAVAFVYYFDATFRPGVNKVHHTYAYELGNSTTFYYFLDYKLTPATRWANHQIDDFTLILSAKNTAKHFFMGTECMPGMKPVVASGKAKMRRVPNEWESPDATMWEMSIRNGSIKYHARNFRPKKELWLRSATFCSGEQIGYTYDRGSTWPLCYHAEDIPDRAQAIRLIRNLPYASRGRVFRDKTLQRYFESLWWYMPNPNYTDDTSDFTPVDWNYIYFKFDE